MVCSTEVFFYDRFSIIKHPLGKKNHPANHINPKKTTTFAFVKRSVTYLRKCPITQYIVSDSGHSTKGLKRGGTTRICKAVKYNDLHLCVFVKTEVVPIKMNSY